MMQYKGINHKEDWGGQVELHYWCTVLKRVARGNHPVREGFSLLDSSASG